jgi:bacterioferritin-associated ferredoxin
MKSTEILVGMKYSLKCGKNNTIAVVINYDAQSEEWTCETASGKTVTVRDASRFLEAIEQAPALKGEEIQSAKDSEPLNIPPEAETIGESKPEKSIFERARAAQVAAEHGFIPQSEADALIAEAASEMARLSSRAKELTEKSAAAKNAAKFGFITQAVADAAEAEATSARLAAKSAGVKSGCGRCKGQMSGLDAAYQILSERGEAMNAKAIANAAMERGLWSPNGATPEMTMSAALQMDAKKGEKARFEKTRPGYYNVRLVQ